MRQEQIANELAKQRANALENTAAMGQELLQEWQIQVSVSRCMSTGIECVRVGLKVANKTVILVTCFPYCRPILFLKSYHLLITSLRISLSTLFLSYPSSSLLLLTFLLALSCSRTSTQVVSLRDENAELKQSLAKAQQRAKAREKELRAEAKMSDDAKAFEWEAAQVYCDNIYYIRGGCTPCGVPS